MAASKLGALGQSSPAANTDTALYTPANTRRAVISSIIICNTTNNLVTYRVYLNRLSTSSTAATALVYEQNLDANGTDALTWGLALDGLASGTGDSLYVRASATGVTFTATGNEEDIS